MQNDNINIILSCKNVIRKNVFQFVVCLILVILSITLLRIKSERIRKNNPKILLKTVSRMISKIYDKEIKYSEVVLEKYPEDKPRNYIMYRYQGTLKLGFNNISVKIDDKNKTVEYEIFEPKIFHDKIEVIGEPDIIEKGIYDYEINPYSREQKVKKEIEEVINFKTSYKQMSKDSIDNKLRLFTKKVLSDEWFCQINWIKNK